MSEQTSSRRVIALIQVAGAFDRADILLELTAKNFEQTWAGVREWLSTNARFFYFDPETGMYVLDEEAKRRGSSVRPERQKPVPGLWCKRTGR
jgi:hypothetical protein